MALPSFEPLTATGDLAAAMVEGIDRFVDAATSAVRAERRERWTPDPALIAGAWDKLCAGKRQQLLTIVGAIDARVPAAEQGFSAAEGLSSLIAEVAGIGPYQVHLVRWPVLAGDGGLVVEGEGLLLVPTDPARPDTPREPVADVILLPDADLTGPRGEVSRAFVVETAGKLAAGGNRVLVPLLIDRDDTLSVVGGVRPTNQPHREFIYRQAFELGRHVIGYELQKVLAAVDRFATEQADTKRPLAVVGYGEGGLLALYAAAVDQRIDAALVSGYFDSRQELWREPIYRNVWSLLVDFGDAELASLIAPRTLFVEASPFPDVDGPPPPHDGRSGAAPGVLTTPPQQRVSDEFARAQHIAKAMGYAQLGQLIPVDRPGQSIATFMTAVHHDLVASNETQLPSAVLERLAAPTRRQRQFEQLVGYNQWLLGEAEYTRAAYWAEADRSSLDTWRRSTEDYRRRFYDEVIGSFDQPLLEPRPRVRKLYDEPSYTGYEVQLDVFPEVFAYGILLVPKDIRPGERRPTVVCQHGLEGRPQDVADPQVDNPSYHRYACRLAERGFVVYAPQNPYIGQDKFRSLQRKLNPLGKSLFSIIIPQHRQTVRWLARLPVVDPQRIGFYGLSYGGKTAMRVPAVVTEYCLSICSADFNEWIWKNASARSPYSYVATGEYEIFEWNLGNTFNYAEMAALIAPRPFMVERGHHDGVAPDEWVAYEYSKVRRLYAALKIPTRTTIEFFDGPHTIHGVGTFAFLHEHLQWPAPH
ncbi:MAG: dienelactone hydrolase family protein [Pirellulales bacterium]|nr:dienelactone hydrolase family protein [Pirellulales bacterium]